MVVKKAFDVVMSKTKLPLCTAYNQCSVLCLNDVCLFVINYLSQSYHELSKTRFYNFVPALRNKMELKLTKLVTGVVCQDFVLALLLLL